MDDTGRPAAPPPLDPRGTAGAPDSPKPGRPPTVLLLLALLLVFVSLSGWFFRPDPAPETGMGNGMESDPAATSGRKLDPAPPRNGEAGKRAGAGNTRGAVSRRVNFQSVPGGASLFLNGRLVGATPLALEDLAPGHYGVRMEKDGHAPRSMRVEVRDAALAFTERLAPLALGGLEVDVVPRGAEVLLDGEVVGVSPLKLDRVRAGPHELLIRKTNFEPYAERIEIVPDQTRLYSEFPLQDKILSLLLKQKDADEQRIGYRIDLAHYYFIIDRLDDAVETFQQAQVLANKKLEFPAEMEPEEKALEERLRGEDRSRLKKEIEKHKNAGLWGTKKASAFREKFEAAQDLISRKEVGSWIWVEPAVKDRIRNNEFAKAEALLVEHLAQAPEGPHALACLTELLKVRLSLRDIQNVEAAFQRLFVLAAERPDLLLDIGQALSAQRDRIRPNDRERLLALAEKAFRRGYEKSKVEAIKSESAYELAKVLTAQKHPEVAIEYFRQGIAGAPGTESREERTYAMAEALRQSGQAEAARAAFLKLSQSKNELIRERARAGLLMLRPAKE